MNVRAALALFVIAACGSHTDPERTPVTVRLTAPTAVTGTWSAIDTSRVLSCAFDVTATVSGGRGDETVEWTGATIRLEAPPALPGMQPYRASSVADWFGANTLEAGSSATAHQNIGREVPFTAKYQLNYRLIGGAPATATATVDCRAP